MPVRNTVTVRSKYKHSAIKRTLRTS